MSVDTPFQADTGARFSRRRTVAANDIDELRHVNNVTWLRYIVQLGHAHYESLGFDFHEDRRAGAVWVVRRHEIDYHRGASEGAELLEDTWVSHVHGARLLRHSRFRLAADGTLLVQARSLWAYVDPITMKPKRIPREVIARYTVLIHED
jgi:acyl-CoA thioester hydrolase